MIEQTAERETEDRLAQEDAVTASVPSSEDRTTADLGHEDYFWLEQFPHPLRRPLAAVAWLVQALIGFVTLLVLLTIVATVPVLNLIALGYLLEVEGQVARSGKLRHALPSLPVAMRIGSSLVGILLWLVPVTLVADYASDARLIAPHSTAALLWNATLVFISIVVAMHLVLAVARGGSWGCFLRPIKNARWLREQFRSGDYWSRADRSWRNFFAALRPWHFFWLGVRGFIGIWVWLALPTMLLSISWYTGSTWLRIFALVAGACLVPVLAWMPFLQVRLAVENRWRAVFEVRKVRELFQHAPLSWLIATSALYALSIPLFLYSLQLRMHVPFDLRVWWDLTFISIAGTFPARVALGWAYHRATVRGRAWIGWIWLNRLLLGGGLACYIWLLFQTPLTHEFAPWQLTHHALLLPFPW